MKTLLQLLAAATILSACASVDLYTETTYGGNASGEPDQVLEQMAKDSERG